MSRLNPESKQASFKPGIGFMFSHYSHVIAQGFGSGLSPIMPGTCGTLFGWASYVLLTARWPHLFTDLVWGVIIVLGYIWGVFLCDRTGRDIGVADHGSIVWDEIIAIWLVFVFVMPANFATQAWAFLVFRFFDMVKPPPIAWFDQHFKGGFGVMWDDILAALYTLLVFALWRAI
jgi:phosphatidylglycerophosphatase A